MYLESPVAPVSKQRDYDALTTPKPGDEGKKKYGLPEIMAKPHGRTRTVTKLSNNLVAAVDDFGNAYGIIRIGFVMW